MPYGLDKVFKTITANPYLRNTYLEIEPCEALKPYVHCFWLSRNDGGAENKTLVIPDLCMDIILYEYNGFNAKFCGINNYSYYCTENCTEHFGIRFYSWSAALFSDEKMDSALNTYDSVERYFSDFKGTLAEEILCAAEFSDKKLIAERYLMKKLDIGNVNNSVLNSIFYLIQKNGNASVKDLADYNAVSQRSLERYFLSSTGVSPKQMLSLIRYQLLWQDAVKRNFSVLDSVFKFGYYDQSHLLREFKKYHGLNLTDARDSVFKMSHFYNTQPLM